MIVDATPRHSLPPTGIRLGWLSRIDSSKATPLIIALLIVGGLASGVAAALNPVIGVGLVVVIAASLVILRRLELGGLVLALLVPPLSGLRAGLLLPSVKVTEALIAGIAGLILVTIRRVRARPWTRVEWTLLTYVTLSIGFGTYDAVDLHSHLTFSMIGTMVGPLQFFLLYRSVRLVLPTERLQGTALRLLLYASVPISLIGVAQQVHVPAVRSIITNITGSGALVSFSYANFNRASSLWPQWTLFAGYLTVVIVVGASAMFEPTFRLMPQRRLYAILAVDGVGLLLSAELSAIIGLVIATVLLAWWAGKLRFLAKVFGVTLVVLGVSTGPYIAARITSEYQKTLGSGGALIPQTLQFRLNVWTTQYFPAIGHRPLDGWGVVIPPVVTWLATESQYVTVLMRGGFPLLGSFAVMMVAVGSSAALLRRDAENAVRRLSARAVLALTIILVPMNVIFPYLEDSGLPQPFWLLVAVLMATVPGRLPPVGLGVITRRRASFGSQSSPGLSHRDRKEGVPSRAEAGVTSGR